MEDRNFALAADRRSSERSMLSQTLLLRFLLVLLVMGLSAGQSSPPPCTTGSCGFGTCDTVLFICICSPGYTGPDCSAPNTAPVATTPYAGIGASTDPPTNQPQTAAYTPAPTGSTDTSTDSPYTQTVTTGAADPCSPSPCLNTGQCYVTFGGGGACSCPHPYTGDRCETDLLHTTAQPTGSGSASLPPTTPSATDACSSNPCAYDGTCYLDGTQSPPGFLCVCVAPWSGYQCLTYSTSAQPLATSPEVITTSASSTPLPDPCVSSPCLHPAATCVTVPSLNGFICSCPAYFTGNRCETYMPVAATTSNPTAAAASSPVEITTPTAVYHDACSAFPCANNGTCYTDATQAAGFICLCNPPWTGSQCLNSIFDTTAPATGGISSPQSTSDSIFDTTAPATGAASGPQSTNGIHTGQSTSQASTNFPTFPPSPATSQGPLEFPSTRCLTSGDSCSFYYQPNPCTPHVNCDVWAEIGERRGDSNITIVLGTDRPGFYVAAALSEDAFMPNSDVLLCYNSHCEDRYAYSYSAPVRDSDLLYDRPRNQEYWQYANTSRYAFTVSCNASKDPQDVSIAGRIYISFAAGRYNESTGEIYQHVYNLQSITYYRDFKCNPEPTVSTTDSTPPTSASPSPTASQAVCSPDPCFNGGSCVPSSFYPGYRCHCYSPWTGTHCSQYMPSGSTVAAMTTPYPAPPFTSHPSATTTSTSTCSPNPCFNGGVCYPSAAYSLGYYCSCPPSWAGTHCTAPSPGTISPTSTYPGGTKHTVTPSPTFPTVSSTASAACNPNPCYSGGSCYLSPYYSGGFSCSCSHGYAGTRCEVYVGVSSQTHKPTSPPAPTSRPYTDTPTTSCPSTAEYERWRGRFENWERLYEAWRTNTLTQHCTGFTPPPTTAGPAP
eukprot:scpid40868/ scgid12101/ Fibropellin-1; Epidermal growth factor-related protein 1; Fibropellin-I; SpEGF I; UEGF-1